MALTQVDQGMLGAQAQYTGFKNRIINGQMMIDQRNAGASFTPANGGYTVDRFVYYSSQASKFTAQQNAGSITPPAGFVNYLGFTSTSAYSLGSGDYFTTSQPVEGLNVADLGWGAAGAQSVTLSFWVRSSLTGTFGGSITNSGSTRSYPFSYSIPVANTWTTISITIAGDTSGTWLKTNGNGMTINFGLGVGTTYSGTAGSWAGANYLSVTGATSVVGTNGATFYITGVQLEKGSTATSFDYRPYGTEFALCQRYYQTNIPYGTAPTNGLTTYISTVLNAYSTSGGYGSWMPYPTAMRTTPSTITFYKPSASVGADGQWVYYNGSSWISFTGTGLAQSSSTGFSVEATRSATFTANAAYIMLGSYAASAEL